VSYPSDLKYTPSHEWVRLDGDVATVGITFFAQDQLGDVVYVDLPEVGRAVSKGESVAEIESTKTVSGIYTPVSGDVVEVNEELSGSEEQVNKSPYDGGWLFKVRVSDPGELAGLLDSAAYQASVAG
jgi:glycine cleavage system H protein